MKRIVASCVLVLVIAAIWAALVCADGTLLTKQSVRTPLRGYVGATAQQYDTLVCGSSRRIELVNFTFYADDSAQTPTLTVNFQSLNSGRVYLKFATTFTANQVTSVALPTSAGPIVFPSDSSIVIYYNLTGATPGTLDTLMAMTTYRVQGL